jgi:hypothetical protein
VFATAATPKVLPEKEIPYDHGNETDFTAGKESSSSRRSQEGKAAHAAIRDEGREAGLPILRQRRSCSVFHKATRRPLPRLLQEALRFRQAGAEGCV